VFLWALAVVLIVISLVELVFSRKDSAMCEEKKGCQRPEELRGDPKDCSPEQIKKCHGDVQEHPCAPADVRDEAGEQ